MGAVRPRVVSVVLDAVDARQLGDFYRDLLGYEYRPGSEPPPPGDPDPAGGDWLVLRDPDRFFHVCIQHVDELPRATWPDAGVPQQLHLDMEVTGIDDLVAAHQRVLELGGSVLFDRTDDPDEPLYVFADPAGHPFCIFVGPGSPA